MGHEPRSIRAHDKRIGILQLSFLLLPRQRALLLALLLYSLSVAILLWLLPAPIHLRFSVKSGGRQFTPTLQSALARLASAVQHPATIQDPFIEQVDLNTKFKKNIPLDPGGQSLARLRDYIHSRDGSLYLTINESDFNMVSAWDGRTGKFLFEKFLRRQKFKANVL